MSQKKTTTKEDVAKANEFAKAQAGKSPEELAAEATAKAEQESEELAAKKAEQEAAEEAAKKAEEEETEDQASAEAEADDKAEIDALAKTIFEQYNFDVIYITSDGSSAFETPELAASYDPDYITVRRPE